MNEKFTYFHLLLALLICFCCATSAIAKFMSPFGDPARCAKQLNGRAATPIEIISCLYEPYRSEMFEQETASSLKTVQSFASKPLRKKIDREFRCMKIRKEICAIDSDVLIWAQDRMEFKILAIEQAKELNTVSIHFKNGATLFLCMVKFVVEGQKYRINDITFQYSTDQPKRDLTFTLNHMFDTFKY